MAKEQKADEEYEFIPADFDEDAFIHREMVSFRTTTILFLWGIVAAAVSYLVFAALDGAKVGWLAGLAIAAVFGVSLKWLYPRLKADIKHFGRREWMGTGFLFFFTWLAFFLIAINPPVSDFAPPAADVHVVPAVPLAGQPVTVHLFVEDNVKVTSHGFRLTGPAGEVAGEGELTDLGHGHHVLELASLPAGAYEVVASASDGERGHETTATFTVTEAAIDYSATAGGVLAGAADSVVVTLDPALREAVPDCRTSKGTVSSAPPCVRTVRLEMLGGGEVVLKLDKRDTKTRADDRWTATTENAGWKAGNNTFDVVVELVDQYQGSVRFDGGELRDGPHTVEVRATPGSLETTPARDPAAQRRNVPGLELPLLAIGLVALAAIARRR